MRSLEAAAVPFTPQVGRCRSRSRHGSRGIRRRPGAASSSSARPATAHAAVLQFTIPGSLTTYKTIRVPLDLRALARRRVTHPHTTARAAGLTLTVQDLDFTHLTYTYTLPGNSQAFTARPRLVDDSGRVVSVAAVGGECSSDAHATNCTETWVFPPQPSGVRLTLTIPTFWLFVHGAWRPRLARGPWRIPFVVP